MKDVITGQSIAVLGGGTHVHPMLSKQPPLLKLQNYPYDINRDMYCLDLVNESKHAIGICRGFQFLSLYHGGELNQDNGFISGNVSMNYLVPRQGQLIVPTDHSQSVVSVGNGFVIGTYHEHIYAAIWSNTRGGYDIGVQFHPEWERSDDKIHHWMDNLTMSFFNMPFSEILPHIVSN